MFIRTVHIPISAVIACALFLGGCTTQSELPQGPDAVWDLVIIGDSSMWELGEAYASQIEKDVGVDVVLHDFALPALSACRSVLDPSARARTSETRSRAIACHAEGC